jgi:hypothetical protein
MEPTWEQQVSTKRAVLSPIPAAWTLPQAVLDEVARAETQSVLHIPASCGILSNREIDITEKHSASDLLRLMAKRELTSHAVTLALCKRAAIAQQLVKRPSSNMV